MCKCKADLLQAQETILALTGDIVAKDALAKKQQARIIEELRGMLGKIITKDKKAKQAIKENSGCNS